MFVNTQLYKEVQDIMLKNRSGIVDKIVRRNKPGHLHAEMKQPDFEKMWKCIVLNCNVAWKMTNTSKEAQKGPKFLKKR